MADEVALKEGFATNEMAADIKTSLGVELATMVLNVKPAQLTKWVEGSETPKGNALRRLQIVHDIIEALDSLDKPEMKMWLVDYSPYLYGVPAAEIDKRPTDVLAAALHRVARGESVDYTD